MFLKQSTSIAAASTLLGAGGAGLYAADNTTIQVALIGCGGRGTGAATNALSVKDGGLKLVAAADVNPDKLKYSLENIKNSFKDQNNIDLPPDRQFVGFDGYKKAMDVLKPGDIVILATPPGFRWVHFTYAIEKGLNVFMEKPVTVDGPTSLKMLELGKKAAEKNLKVGVGLMVRHCRERQELHKRIQDGEIGDLLLLRGYRMAGPTATAAVPPRPKNDKDELLYQIANFHGFLFLSGGAVSDFLIHTIDEACWMKNDWPVKAQAVGGRHYREEMVDQNFDSYAIEYTFKDGTKFFMGGRTVPGCYQDFASYAHGSKGLGIISTAGHVPGKCRIYEGQTMSKDKLKWSAAPQPNPYQLEWDDLVAAIKNDTPYNEVERGVMASAVTSLGRMAAHTGQELSLDDLLHCDHEFAPEIDKLVLGGPSPLPADANGKYPIPLPGIIKNREYA
jgi:predicted dehydrogenase